jgi:hypothetical protein
MSYVIDVKWLMILPLGAIGAFASWVLWNLIREIQAERRQWVWKYSDSGVFAGRSGQTSGTESGRR